MLQYRARDPTKRRRIKRDVSSIAVKGIAGISLKRLDGVVDDEDDNGDASSDVIVVSDRAAAASLATLQHRRAVAQLSRNNVPTRPEDYASNTAHEIPPPHPPPPLVSADHTYSLSILGNEMSQVPPDPHDSSVRQRTSSSYHHQPRGLPQPRLFLPPSPNTDANTSACIINNNSSSGFSQPGPGLQGGVQQSRVRQRRGTTSASSSAAVRNFTTAVSYGVVRDETPTSTNESSPSTDVTEHVEVVSSATTADPTTTTTCSSSDVIVVLPEDYTSELESYDLTTQGRGCCGSGGCSCGGGGGDNVGVSICDVRKFNDSSATGNNSHISDCYGTNMNRVVHPSPSQQLCYHAPHPCCHSLPSSIHCCCLRSQVAAAATCSNHHHLHHNVSSTPPSCRLQCSTAAPAAAPTMIADRRRNLIEQGVSTLPAVPPVEGIVASAEEVAAAALSLESCSTCDPRSHCCCSPSNQSYRC